MKINIELYNNRVIKCDQNIIGKTLENEATVLHFNLNEEMVDKDFYIEFEKADGTKFSTPRIDILTNAEEAYLNDEHIKRYVEYAIPNSLLDIKGNLKCEVVLRKNGIVFKTYTLKFTILNSINASEEVAEKYPDFINEAQKVLNESQKVLGDVEKALPIGGKTGQVLTKNSDDDYDSIWTNAGQGDMTKEVYDTNQNGIVDNAEKVNNHTVEKDVPSDAIFTDTIYDDTNIKELIKTNQKNIETNANNITKVEEKIPTNVSQLMNDKGYISSIPDEYITETVLNSKGYLTSENDPTVPSHVKSITQENITSWNNKSEFDGSYNNLTDKPFINLIGTESIPIYLRDLQTGAYILNGTCSPYNGSNVFMEANYAVTHVTYFETVTAVQIFYPPYNQVQYFEIYDDNYTTNTVSLNKCENTDNKTTIINNESTDTQYPSALSVKNYVEAIVENLNNEIAVLKGNVLWENSNSSNPISSEQTINLSSNSYDFIEIFYKHNTTLNIIYSQKIPKGYGSRIGIETTDGISYRTLNYVNDMEYTLGTITTTSQYSDTNRLVIPLYIVGISTN